MDRDTFRELLLKAIGPRTQKSFAAMCGMTPQYLNRLMHSDSIVPTMDTLTRIASHAYGGVTLYVLCRACDIDPATVSQEPHFSPWQLGSVHKRAEAVNQALAALDKNWFHRNPGPNAMVFDSVDQITDMISDTLSTMLETDENTFSCELIPDEEGNAQPARAEDIPGMLLYPVVLAWEDFDHVCRHKFMLQAFAASEKPKYVVVVLDLQMANLEKAFPKEVGIKENDPNGVYTEIFYRNVSSADESPEERLLKQLFRHSDMQADVPAVEEGEGFYTPDLEDPEVRKTVAAFFKNHAHMIPDDAGVAENLYADYVDQEQKCELCNGTFGLVAHIMSRETGFPFTFIDNPDFYNNRPLIMMADILIDKKDGPDRQTVRSSLIPYARELGIDRVGSVWHQYYASLPINPEVAVQSAQRKKKEGQDSEEE